MKITAKEFLFFSAYILFIFTKIVFMDSTYGNLISNQLKNILLYTSYLLFILKIIIDKKYDKKGILLVFILTILGCIISYFADVNSILILFLIIYAARNVEFSKIAKVSLVEIALLCVFIIISCKLGIIANYIFIRKNGSTRNALGFSYVSKLPVFVMEMEFLYLYLKEKNKKKVGLVNILVMVMINIWVYMLTDVKNGFGLSMLMIFLYIICIKKEYLKFKNKVLKVIVCSTYIICLLISIFLTVNYDSKNKTYLELNDALTGRLAITHNMMKKYPVSMFGNSIVMRGSTAVKYKKIKSHEYSYIDSAYIQILLRYGIIFSAVFAFAYIFMMKKSIKKNDIMIVIWLFILAISSIIDDTIINIQYNCALLYLIQATSENNKKIVTNDI